MPVDASKDDLLIGVTGAGAMGRGIVQVAAAGGVNVRLYDLNPDRVRIDARFENGFPMLNGEPADPALMMELIPGM